MLDLTVDHHVHTAFSAGRDSISVLVAAAERLGLSELTLADEVGPETGWLPSYLANVQRAQQRTDVTLRAGVEVEAIGIDGWTAFPSDLSGLEVVSVAVGALPMPSGLAGPATVRSLVDARVLTRAEVVEMLVTVTARALERVNRYAPTRLARPLSFLWRAGFNDDDVDETMLGHLVEVCRRTGSLVEISERHMAPSIRVARLFAQADVRLVAASDARQASEVGRWRYVERVAGELTSSEILVPITPPRG